MRTTGVTNHFRREFWRLGIDLVRFKSPVAAGLDFLPFQIYDQPLDVLQKTIRPTFKALRATDDRGDADFVGGIPATICGKAAAVQGLKKFFDEEAEFLRLDIDGNPYELIFIRKTIDCVNYSKSSFEFLEYGRDDPSIPHSDILTTKRFVLNATNLPHVFRPEGPWGVNMNIIVSNEFKRAYEEKRFTGFFFQRVGLSPLQ